MPDHICRDKVLFGQGQRSFYRFFFVEAEAVVAEAEAVDGLAASTSLVMRNDSELSGKCVSGREESKISNRMGVRLSTQSKNAKMLLMKS